MGIQQQKLEIPSNSSSSSSSNSSLTLLDFAKSAIELLITTVTKSILPTPLMSMLLEGGDSNLCLLSSLGDPPIVIEESLKNIQCSEKVINTSRISFPISHALSIINKYRMKNSTDGFGFGRSPCRTDPVDIVIFTDGRVVVGKEVFIQKFNGSSKGVGDDFTSDSFRWDHRVFLVIVRHQIKGEEVIKVSDLPKDLTDLCTITGGDVMICQGISETISAMHTLALKLSHKSVGVKFTTTNLETESLNNPPSSTLCRLISMKGQGEWPIPESFVIDNIAKSYPLRNTHPILTINRNIGIGLSPSINSLYRTAKELDINFDLYDINVCNSLSMGSNTNQNLYKTLGLIKDERYHVFVSESSKLDIHSTNNSVLNLSQIYPPPFAILSPGKSPGSIELMILPFNYPKLIPIIKSALDMIKSQQTTSHISIQQIFQQPWSLQWKSDFSNYLSNVPPYYYKSLKNLMKRMGLYNLVTGMLGEYTITKQIEKKLLYAQSISTADIVGLETAARNRWPSFNPSVSDIAMASSESKYVTCQSILDIENSFGLISNWEKIRKLIYNGPSGLTVNDLCIVSADEKGGNSHVHKNHYFEKLNPFYYQNSSNVPYLCRDWMAAACGLVCNPQLKTKDSGKYLEVLARRESLRDPLNLDPPKDEDLPSGVLKRKFEVHFGNPFAGLSLRKTSSKVSKMVNSGADEVFELPLSEDAVILSNNHIEDPFKEVHSFFMDTPLPEEEEDTNINEEEFSLNEKKSLSISIINNDNNNSSSLNISQIDDISKSSKVIIDSPTISTSSSPLTITSIISSPGQINENIISSIIPELPLGWVKCFSKRQNRDYWFQASSGKSVWIEPT